MVAACVGCAMCQAPYDYCAATIGPNGQPTGGFMTRQGSVLGGVPGVPVYKSEPTLATPVGQGPTQPAEATPVSATSPAGEEEAGVELP
jgi:hypothetical protein